MLPAWGFSKGFYREVVYEIGKVVRCDSSRPYPIERVFRVC